MPVVSATAVCAARTSPSYDGRRIAIDRRFDTGLTGFGIGRRDHARDLARDIEVHRALRLQHAHQLREVEATGEWEPRSHLGNVAHCASLWTVVQGTVAVTGVSGFIGQRLLPLLDASPDVTRIVGLDVRDPARRARKLTFHRARHPERRSRVRTCTTWTPWCISPRSSARFPTKR